MAINVRYESTTDLPEAGVRLANGPVLSNYLNVLNTALNNNATLNGGTSYNESDNPTREISYVYALNSIYRELLRWQNQQPDDEEILGLRQEIREMFPYFMGKEFPLPPDSPVSNFEINDDCIQIESKDPQTNQIMDPQAFVIDAPEAERLSAFLNKIDGFIDKQYSSLEFNTTDAQELKFQKKVMQTSANFMRKMQYFLARKAENKQVYDFRTADEKARTYRNTFKKQIENLTGIYNNKDTDFSKNTQVLANSLDNLGMDLVWYQEPPYEAEFVDHLDEMVVDLQAEKTPDNFYTAKLPILLDLCDNLHEYNPQEAAHLHEAKEKFLQNPDKTQLTEIILETQRVSYELRNIDFAKSRAMRAAWNGLIANPPQKQLSAFVKDILLIRSHIADTSATPEMQQKVAAYTAVKYKVDDYDVSKSKIWNVCSQVPQFAAQKDNLVGQLCAMSIPPEKVSDLTYNDIAFLLNRANLDQTKSIGDKDGIAIASDKEQYLRDLVQNHEKELRKSLQNYYQQKFMMQLINDGTAQKKSDAKIQKKAATEAAAKVEKVFAALNGTPPVCPPDFNCHHVFALSNISYFEKATGKPFTEINKNILFVNNDVHEILHLNENMMSARGQVHLGQYDAYRTKYINKDRKLEEDRHITGYIGRAFSFMIMPKAGIKAMIDFKSFIFDKETLLENIKIQQALIQYNKENKGKNPKLSVPHLSWKRLGEFLAKHLKPAKKVAIQSELEAENTGNLTELQKARGMDKMNQERRTGNLEVIDKTPQPKKVPVQGKLNSRVLSWHQDKKKKFRK